MSLLSLDQGSRSTTFQSQLPPLSQELSLLSEEESEELQESLELLELISECAMYTSVTEGKDELLTDSDATLLRVV